MSGTVNISRGIWHDVAFKDEPFSEREAFIWIIMEASYKPREKRVGSITVSLERGQLVTSVRFMCSAWSWSKSRVDRFLKRLENRDMIGTDSGTGINVITVCKYNDYQNGVKPSGTAGNEKRDSSGTAAGQQRDKPKKGLIPEARKMQKEDTNVSLSLVPTDDGGDSISEAISMFKEAAEKSGWPVPRVLSKARRSALTARLKECGGIEGWRVALEKAQASAHCCGDNQRGWVMTFDFITTQSSFAKLMEGNYDNRTNNHSKAHSQANAGASAIAAAARIRRSQSGDLF